MGEAVAAQAARNRRTVDRALKNPQPATVGRTSSFACSGGKVRHFMENSAGTGVASVGTVVTEGGEEAGGDGEGAAVDRQPAPDGVAAGTTYYGDASGSWNICEISLAAAAAPAAVAALGRVQEKVVIIQGQRAAADIDSAPYSVAAARTPLGRVTISRLMSTIGVLYIGRNIGLKVDNCPIYRSYTPIKTVTPRATVGKVVRKCRLVEHHRTTGDIEPAPLAIAGGRNGWGNIIGYVSPISGNIVLNWCYNLGHAPHYAAV